MNNRFQDKTVLVTGASGGIGSSLAKAFAAEGALVYLGCHRHVRRAEKLLSNILEKGGKAEILQMDMADRDSINAAFDKLSADRSSLDILINNAGVRRDDHAVTMSDSDWQDVISINLDGPFFCSRQALRLMQGISGGVILNISSISAIRANPGQANYAASKGGLIALTRTLAKETAGRGIRVNCLVPGMFESGMGLTLDRNLAEKIRSNIPLARFGRADELSRAALFLASDEASYITGAVLNVDGGLSL